MILPPKIRGATHTVSQIHSSWKHAAQPKIRQAGRSPSRAITFSRWTGSPQRLQLTGSLGALGGSGGGLFSGSFMGANPHTSFRSERMAMTVVPGDGQKGSPFILKRDSRL